MSRFGRTLAKPSRDGHRLRRSGKSFPSGRGLSAFLLRCSSCPAWGGTRANRQKSANPAERTSVRQTLRCAMTLPALGYSPCSVSVFPLVVGHCFGPNSCALRTAVLLLRFLLHTPEKYAPCGFRLPRKLFLSRSPTPARKKKLSRSPRKSTTWACEQRPLA